jgi:hypothetical protein
MSAEAKEKTGTTSHEQACSGVSMSAEAQEKAGTTSSFTWAVIDTPLQRSASASGHPRA